ncbi:hypothetical protein [Achromobacter aloeverae]|uniref:Uncharacterized protein n=1 Tax=Achromobacter aloeverae TaxID=1750518 RepID=A0A4V1MS26_9BURK|nr:hypothetical protein [Achromobacter aloeverae]RXN88010.1 hypothetical protein C7R54_15655 [Achromobacter aloeverae]
MEGEVIDTQAPETTAPETQPEVQTEKPKGDVPDWALKRFGELTAARKAAEERAIQAEQRAQDLAKQMESGANGNVEELAKAYAERLAPQLVEKRRAQERLDTGIQSINAEGIKEFGVEFDRAIQQVGMAGLVGPDFISALVAVPDAAKVVQYLGTNLEEAHRLAGLAPVEMAVELAKLSPKAKKAFAKPVSSAPAPIEPIEGRGTADGEPAVGTPEWFEWRNKNARKRRR